MNSLELEVRVGEASGVVAVCLHVLWPHPFPSCRASLSAALLFMAYILQQALAPFLVPRILASNFSSTLSKNLPSDNVSGSTQASGHPAFESMGPQLLANNCDRAAVTSVTSRKGPEMGLPFIETSAVVSKAEQPEFVDISSSLDGLPQQPRYIAKSMQTAMHLRLVSSRCMCVDLLL